MVANVEARFGSSFGVSALSSTALGNTFSIFSSSLSLTSNWASPSLSTFIQPSSLSSSEESSDSTSQPCQAFSSASSSDIPSSDSPSSLSRFKWSSKSCGKSQQGEREKQTRTDIQSVNIHRGVSLMTIRQGLCARRQTHTSSFPLKSKSAKNK